MARRAAQWIGRTWARVSYGRQIEPTWLEHTEHDVPVRDLAQPFHGFRIAQLSDFHGGHHLPSEYLHDVIRQTHDAKPDVITLTGDYIHKGYQHIDTVARILGQLKAPLGVFAVLGNHDFSVRNALGIRRHRGLHQAVADALAQQGITVLRNQSITLKQGDATLSLAGIDDLWSGECDPQAALATVCPNTPRIILAHNPQTVDKLAGHRCDLMLSGHTHGGQVNWPGVGRLFLGKQGRRFAAGMYQHGSTPVYVNKGVGFGWRFRFQVRPELATFNLRPTLSHGLKHLPHDGRQASEKELHRDHHRDQAH